MGDVATFPLGKPTKSLYGVQGIWTSETSDDIILKLISHQRIISKLLGAPLKPGHGVVCPLPPVSGPVLW